MTNHLQVPISSTQPLDTAFISSTQKDPDASDASTPTPTSSPEKPDSDLSYVPSDESRDSNQSSSSDSSQHITTEPKDGTHRISDFSGPLQALRLQISQLESWLQTEIRKAMATDHSNKKHQFDVWHLSKSIKKKILVIKPQKLLNEVKPWIPSICNHIWYCSRQADGDSDEET
ncbi:unnamed protein product [Mytilus edulis]|uniref:Uncharacterized protein n=1 Tax=Mytilus edulis TaxID=6550 RepID=A0A8S3SJ59_MYTED|nr:unnamed protein product [Mytilus edulis]